MTRMQNVIAAVGEHHGFAGAPPLRARRDQFLARITGCKPPILIERAMLAPDRAIYAYDRATTIGVFNGEAMLAMILRSGKNGARANARERARNHKIWNRRAFHRDRARRIASCHLEQPRRFSPLA